MDVAVIIPTHNRATLLPTALDSVIRQTVDCDIEIIVIDDGSTDDTEVVIRPYVDGYRTGSRVVYLLKQAKQGVVAARNAGIAQSRAPLVAFLDSDDFWREDKLAMQVAPLLADERLAVVHTSFRYVDERGALLNGDKPPALGERPDNPCTGACMEALLREDLVIFSSVLTKRSLIDRAAAAEPHGLPFAPGLTNAQDYDLLLRLALWGEFLYLTEPLTCYRRHDAHAAMSNPARAYGFHCRVQMDFVRRWGERIGINADQSRRFAGDFLYSRAASAFWRRDFQLVRALCELAHELEISHRRLDELRRKSERPMWLYKCKDLWDKWRGMAAADQESSI